MNLSDREMVKAVNQLTRQSPVFKKFNQLKYKSPKGYMDYDTVIFLMAKLLTTYQFSDREIFDQDITHRFSVIILNQAYHLGFHPYWLHPSLFDAFNNSHLPKQLAEFKRIVPVGLLFFPPKLKNPDGQLLKWVLYYHRLADESILPIQLEKIILEIKPRPDNNLSWVTLLEDGSQYGVNHSLDCFARLATLVKDNKLNYESYEIFINEMLLYDGKNIETKSEQDFTDKVTEILIQTLLYLQLKPNEINPTSLSNSHPRSLQKLSKKQPLSPNIIGQDYHLKRDYDSKVSTEHRGSPATHWRSGHWRHQSFGSREKPTLKIIWIEPMLING